MVSDLHLKRILDIGCGDGVALRFFRGLGASVCGLDGVPQADIDIQFWDFTKGADKREVLLLTGMSTLSDPWDAIWMCEFVEHLEEKYLSNLFQWINARYIYMTHAEPGQDGHHHVNCQTEDYWRGAFAAHGYLLDSEMTTAARVLAGANPSPWNHFKRAGLVFYRA